MSSDSKETPGKKAKLKKQNQTKKKKKYPIPQYSQTKMEGQFNSGTM